MRKFIKQYKKKIILVLFLSLSAVAYFLRNPQVLPTYKKEESLFSDYKGEEIKKIKIKQGEEEVVLVKKGKEWLVETKESSPADSQKVEEAVETAGKLKRANQVSKNKSNHETFGVGKEAKKVVLSNGGADKVLIIGRQGPNFTSNYFRKEGEKEVYLSGQSLEAVYGLSEWRDLKEDAEASESGNLTE